MLFNGIIVWIMTPRTNDYKTSPLWTVNTLTEKYTMLVANKYHGIFVVATFVKKEVSNA